MLEAASARPRTRPRRRPRRPGVAFLAPLDPFVWDRDFLRSLYGFDYVWEVYVPAAKRRWGYYVLPLLFGDRLVGRIEPRFDRRAGRLQVIDLWWEDGFDPMTTRGVRRRSRRRRSRRIARFGNVKRVALPRTTRHRLLVRAIRDRLGPRAAGSEIDPDDLPGAPVAGPVAGADPDFAVVGPSPGHGLAGRGGRAP